MRLAALDIGSNTVHVLVADVVRGRLEDVAHYVEMPELGPQVARNGVIGSRAAYALRAVRKVMEQARSHGYDELLACATQAIRQASDGPAFVRQASQVLGVPVDLGKIAVPAYVLATREDHIVPWRTGYRTTQLLGGDTRFVLGASGHIAGIVNPASKNRRSYWSSRKVPEDADAWFAEATEKPGSWWPDWSAWLESLGGERIKARTRLGNTKFKPIEPAPGRYVKHRIV